VLAKRRNAGRGEERASIKRGKLLPWLRPREVLVDGGEPKKLKTGLKIDFYLERSQKVEEKRIKEKRLDGKNGAKGQESTKNSKQAANLNEKDIGPKRKGSETQRQGKAKSVSS